MVPLPPGSLFACEHRVGVRSANEYGAEIRRMLVTPESDGYIHAAMRGPETFREWMTLCPYLRAAPFAEEKQQEVDRIVNSCNCQARLHYHAYNCSDCWPDCSREEETTATIGCWYFFQFSHSKFFGSVITLERRGPTPSSIGRHQTSWRPMLLFWSW